MCYWVVEHYALPCSDQVSRPIDHSLWLWVVPFLVAVAAIELVLRSPIQSAWVSVFPFLAEPEGYSLDAIFQSQEILGRLVGAWWFFALFVVQAAFNTILGEEFLFRGVLG